MTRKPHAPHTRSKDGTITCSVDRGLVETEVKGSPLETSLMRRGIED
jgi:hypothetical protein